MSKLLSRSVLLSTVSTAVVLMAAPVQNEFYQPLVFEPNQGQAPRNVKWIGKASGYQLALTSEGLTTVMSEGATAEAAGIPASRRMADGTAKPLNRTHARIEMKLNGARLWEEVTGLQPTGGRSNYLLGSDPKQWRTNIPHYSRVRAAQVYDGIDLVLYDRRGDLEYDFVVAPGADPKQIQLAFDGMDSVRVDKKSGDLLLATANGSELRHARPKIYQQVGDQQIDVGGGYQILDKRQVSFTLASYDRSRPLVIDPTVRFTTFMAGNNLDSAIAIALDNTGTYVTGETDSTNFPVVGTMGTNPPGTDAFVTKLSPTGSIVFSTYLGGSGRDVGWGIAVDSTGIFITGDTTSGDFPMQSSLFPSRSPDAFVTKLSLNGNVLIYSGYLGGSNADFASGIAVDAAHAAWVVGSTRSSDFPIRGGPSAGQQPKFGGSQDAYLARIAPDGLSVAFSTFIGGPNGENGLDVAVDSTGSVYATGSAGNGFPITTGMKSCNNLPGGGAFVVRRKGSGTQSVYSTCIGPGTGSGIAVDSGFNVYVAGSAPAGFPTTPGAFQPTKPNPSGLSAIGVKLNSSGKVVSATYLGGSGGSTTGLDVAVGKGGTFYVTGSTSSTDFPGVPPLVPNPTAGFVSQLNAQATGLNHTTRLGAGVHSAAVLLSSVRFIPPQIYTCGYRYSGGTTMDKVDAFIVKLEEDSPIIR